MLLDKGIRFYTIVIFVAYNYRKTNAYCAQDAMPYTIAGLHIGYTTIGMATGKNALDIESIALKTI